MVRRSFYIPEELVERLRRQALQQHRSINRTLTLLLEEHLDPLIGDDLLEYRRSRSPVEAEVAQAVMPKACPECGDSVFFRLLRGNRYACDACDGEGTY